MKKLLRVLVVAALLLAIAIPCLASAECEHVWSTEYRVETPATCTTAGKKVLYCTKCNTAKPGSGEELPATGKHSGSFVRTVTTATCSWTGLDVYKCDTCHNEYNVTVAKNPNNHPSDWVEVGTYGDEGNCQTKSWKATKKCTKCDTYLDKTYGNVGEHHFVKSTYVPTKPCKEHGWEGWKCDVDGCGAWKKEKVETPLAKHIPDQAGWIVSKEPTCAKKGSRYTYCTVCGDKITEAVPTVDHEFGPWKITVKGTCKVHEEQQRVCKKCGFVDKWTSTAYADHNKVVETVAATCTENGTVITKCSVCGKEFSKQTLLAEGHKYYLKETKAHDCIPGESAKVCSVCGDKIDVVTEPAPKGHTPGEWKTVRKPSATQDGKKLQFCTVCGAQLGKKYIPATGSTSTKTSGKTIAFVKGEEVADYAKIDLSKDTITELDLVDAKGAKVGKLVVEVKEGTVTVKYELSAVPTEAFLTFVNEAPSKDITAEKAYEFEKAISVADELAGAAAAYIYVKIEF